MQAIEAMNIYNVKGNESYHHCHIRGGNCLSFILKFKMPHIKHIRIIGGKNVFCQAK